METRTVLIVEDEQALSSLYEKILKDAGIDSIISSTGREGVELALTHHPDLILMDVMLPDISGHDAVEKIRLDSWGKKAKIIYLTNRDDAESIFKAVSHGGASDEYIIKAHTDNQELLNKIRTAII